MRYIENIVLHHSAIPTENPKTENPKDDKPEDDKPEDEEPAR